MASVGAQERLYSEPFRNKAKTFAAVVMNQNYLVTAVVVCKSFALSSKLSKTGKGLNLNNVFSKNNYSADFVKRKITVTLIPTLRPTLTLALLRRLLYGTSEVPLKLSHIQYNVTN